MSRENTDLPRREFLTALGALGIAGASLGPTATLVRGAGRKASGARHLVQHADHFGLFEAEIDHGVLTRVIPFAKDPKPTPMVQTLPNRVYSPSRIHSPMVRRGYLARRYESDPAERGAGDFVRVSWERALDLVAEELSRVKATYGNQAIHNWADGWSYLQWHARDMPHTGS